MKLKFGLSVAALATAGLAAPAMAAETVNVNVQVEEIAVLSTTQASATMIIDDNQDGFMGNPTSVAKDNFGNVAAVQLETNFSVDAVRFDWDTSGTGVVPEYDDAWAAAIGSGTGNILAVLPQASILDGENGSFVGGGGSAVFGSNTQIDVTGPFGNGTHYFGIGVSTNWGNTMPGQPEFAVPDTYEAEFEATIVPTL